MKLVQRFQEFVHAQNLFSAKDKLLLAVSGGVDSVVLCELCSQTGYNFVIAHCNFQLRGAESQRDEDFVVGLAKKYGKEIFVKKFDTETYATEHKLSIQAAARELRYDWFHDIVNGQRSIGEKDFQSLGLGFSSSEQSPSLILTAHHLDDNIETLLMNFFKGTGVAGLHGILPRQGKIIRPLLFAKKEEIKTFASDAGLQWVEDSSNTSDKYSRNFLRHQIIPLVEKIYPTVINNLSANIERFKEMELLYKTSIEQQKKKLLEQKGEELHIPVLKLKKTEALRTVLYEIIKDYGFSSAQVEETLHLLDSESGKYIQSHSHRILKNRNWLIISPNEVKEAAIIIIDEPSGHYSFTNGSLLFETVEQSNFKMQTSNLVAQLEVEKIKFPLILRKWKKGDYFYPLGMKKKKKLARFFIDQKLSQTDKEKVWVMEMGKKIIWVVGMRIDDRYKINTQTKKVLRIVFNKL